MPAIQIDPCEYCTEAEFDRGHNVGYDKGFDAAESNKEQP
jgi:hypothetical protein